ncbi:hypothetical protein ACHAWF_015835 [Thalassiosira exigua]
MSTIRYFLPEDGDNEDTPNVFVAPKPSRPGYPPMLGQIRGSFPLPGSYHFRFKTALIPGTDRDKNALPVWMDCVDDSEPVPVWQNSIIAKVTRVDMEDDDEYDEDFAGAGVSNEVPRSVSNLSAPPVHSAPPKAAETNTAHSTDSLLGALDGPPAQAPAAPAASAASSVHSSTENLLDVDHHPPAASGGGLLDMDNMATANSYHGSGANTPTHEHNDLLNMSAPMPSQTRPNHAAHHGSAPAPPVQQRAQPMQQGRPQQAPMSGGYPIQYPPQQGQYPQQGMQRMPVQPQQQRNQQAPPNGGGKNAFDKFSGNTLDPLGNLNWSLS